MRIGIGAVAGILGGPATYARQLVRALAFAGGHEYVVFTDRPDAFAELDLEVVHVPLRTAYHQFGWDHVRLPRLLAERRVDLYHGTKNVLPWRLPAAAVVTVHDLAVYACPETFAWPQRIHLRLSVPPSVARAARVIADSEHARGDLIARFALAPERVVAIPLGVVPTSAPAAAAEVARSASGYEGFGLTVAEAMASGCAVVAVDTSSIPEVVGDAGLLVPSSDASLLAAALSRLIAEPETRAALAVRGRERTARFTWEATARRTRQV